MSRATQAFLLRLQHNTVDTRPQVPDTVVDNEALFVNQQYLGSFRKGLQTTDGKVSAAEYRLLVNALRSGDFSALKGKVKGLVDPLGAYYFDDQGPDPSCISIGMSPPAFSSLAFAKDLEQIYAMSLVRDVPFTEYGTNPGISELAQYLQRTPRDLFRGYAQEGPIISQLLLATPYQVLTPQDYLTDRGAYDRAHSNNADQKAQNYQVQPRYISNLRDLASYTFYDYSIQAYLECVLSLAKHHPTALINPYAGQPYGGFLAFNTPFALDLISKAGALALKATWYHKWLVHRLARPEEIAYEVDRLVSGRCEKYNGQVHDYLLNSPIVQTVMNRQGTALLSQTFSVGAPAHPSFPSGHTAIAGACVTILKALYKSDYTFSNPMVASADGKRLVPWTGAPLLMSDELTKLADNIGLGRTASGVHYLFDNQAGYLLGEKIGLRLLSIAKDNLTFKNFNFVVRKFDGTTVTI